MGALQKTASKVVAPLVLALAAHAALAPEAAAQARVKAGVAGSGLFSLEEGGGSAFGGMGLIAVGPRHGLGFRVDLTVVDGDGVTTILGAPSLVYVFDTPSSVFHPYLLGGGGIAHAADETDPFLKFGGGFEYHIARRNRGPVLFLEPTFDLIFGGDDGGGTRKAIQANLGIRLGD